MKLKKIKNTLLVVLTLALVSAASIAITYAATYNDTTISGHTNTFVNDEIAVKLSEKRWDGEDAPFDEDVTETLTVLGQNQANGYFPEKVIAKDPKLTNISDSTNADGPSVWAGIKLTYTIKVGSSYYAFKDYEAFSAVIATANFNTTNWTAIDAGDKYYYNSELENQNTTEPLFSAVTINAQTKFDAIKETSGTNAGKYAFSGLYEYDNTNRTVGAAAGTVYTDGLPEFYIVVSGYAVQYEGVDADTAETQLTTLMA